MNKMMDRAANLSPNAANVRADPTLIPFDKMSAKLSDAGQAQLSAMIPAFSVAKVLIVEGYCNRKDVGNAKAAAQARALAVRDFLVLSGIQPSKIKIESDTSKPMHAVRVNFFG